MAQASHLTTADQPSCQAVYSARPMSSTFENAVSRMLGEAPELRPLSLRFRDQGSEDAFQRDYFADNVGLIRLAHVFGIVGWVVLGVLAQTLLSGPDAAWDAVIRVIAVSLTVLSLLVTYRPWFEARWQGFVSVVVLASGLLGACSRSSWRTIAPTGGTRA